MTKTANKTYAEYLAEAAKRKPSVHLQPPEAQLPSSARPIKPKTEKPPLDASHTWFPRQRFHKHKVAN